MSKRKHSAEDDAIVVTLSMNTIRERRGGLRQILTEWHDADGERSTWWYKCGTAPTRDVVTVFWVIGGRIRYKSTLADIRRNETMRFSNRTAPMFGKVWLVLFDFQPIPRDQQIPMKGFQGFRYINSNQFNIG